MTTALHHQVHHEKATFPPLFQFDPFTLHSVEGGQESGEHEIS
jgi:hypothetical protein